MWANTNQYKTFFNYNFLLSDLTWLKLFYDINYFKYIIKLKVFAHIWIMYKNIIKPWAYDFEASKKNK